METSLLGGYRKQFIYKNMPEYPPALLGG